MRFGSHDSENNLSEEQERHRGRGGTKQQSDPGRSDGGTALEGRHSEEGAESLNNNADREEYDRDKQEVFFRLGA